MVYLDNSATSFPKLKQVENAMLQAMRSCANPGRSGHGPSMAAAEVLYRCREEAAKLFRCHEEQVVFTQNCTHGLNVAIRTLVHSGDRVVITGFEHNAVTRPLYDLGANVTVAGRRLFDQSETLEQFEKALKRGQKAAIFTHVSNVFGYILPVWELANLCKQYQVPFIVDAAQSAGVLEVDMETLGADFIAMPGHKGLLGPMGTGVLLCGRLPAPLICGGTGSMSESQEMPDVLPDRAEAGTLNISGIAGLAAGIRYVNQMGTAVIRKRQQDQVHRCVAGLQRMGIPCFSGKDQAGVLSFLPAMDCQEGARLLWNQGIATRAGLHCAPLAHESAGTLSSGTVRISFGHDATNAHTDRFLAAVKKLS